MSGLLLHPSALPSPDGIGDLGEQARRFVRFLADSGQTWWQMLPVGPLAHSSPYHSTSALAGNPLLISLADLEHEGWLPSNEPVAAAPQDPRRVSFDEVRKRKMAALGRAHEHFVKHASAEEREAFDAFRSYNMEWLDDYTLFEALKTRHQGAFTDWPRDLVLREDSSLEAARRELHDQISIFSFAQYVFHHQWRKLKSFAEEHSIRLLGDIPIFVSTDSADVWAHSEIFKLDEERRPRVVAGVPPDYFAEDGQLWGNPLYDWELLKARGYDWWIERFSMTLGRFHAARVDHFIGFYRAWEVDRDAPNAKDGTWTPGPQDDFFNHLRGELGGDLPIVAEDLGLLIDPIRELRDRVGLPGLRVLQFGFDNEWEDNEHRPHNYPANSVGYTGTHDNDTILGWWSKLPDHTRDFVRRYGQIPDDNDIHLRLMGLVAHSPANLVVFPVQDLLGLPTEHRMNTPGTTDGNWEWRLLQDELDDRAKEQLAGLTRDSGRFASTGGDPS